MKIIFTWKQLIVIHNNTEITRYDADCNVRNELNKRRLLHNTKEVIYTFPSHGHRKPYMPRQFPSGIFKITDLEWINEKDSQYKEFGPVKIKTNATRLVFTWRLNLRGEYDKPSGIIQEDHAYWNHFTESRTTLGCIRCIHKQDIMSLANIIKPILGNNEEIFLEVL